MRRLKNRKSTYWGRKGTKPGGTTKPYYRGSTWEKELCARSRRSACKEILEKAISKGEDPEFDSMTSVYGSLGHSSYWW
jgi:hypothetical protein